MTPDDEIHSSEDEAVASDLDMHALILGGLHQDHECPVKTADEVCSEYCIFCGIQIKWGDESLMMVGDYRRQ